MLFQRHNSNAAPKLTSTTSSNRNRKFWKVLVPSLATIFLIVIAKQEQDTGARMRHLASKPEFEFKATATSTSTPTTATATPWVCIYDPDDHTECDEMLSTRLPRPTKYQLPGPGNQLIDRQRWLFFGDSTMSRLYHHSNLKDRLNPNKEQENCPAADITCLERDNKRDRCFPRHSLFDFEHPKEWIPPDPLKAEGPLTFYPENPICNECSSCNIYFHECSHVPREIETEIQVQSAHVSCTNNSTQVHGGFFTQNFARDVELQTPEFHTTQENYAAYISRTWNTPELVRDWGKPICVMREGMHNIINRAIRGMDKDVFDAKFTDNILWVLKTYQPVCQHFVWLGNTANGNETLANPFHFLQTMENMKQMDTEIKEVIESEPELRSMVSFIDVHDASLFRPHMDFVHMGSDWCTDLGNWLASYM
mmetsp:Transcript_6838/g.10245  ORF Transcript_6838/g.10245 Transcript_6838/m.10245 type:complete len:423 (+) Transcript_6838:138-1406(+)